MSSDISASDLFREVNNKDILMQIKTTKANIMDQIKSKHQQGKNTVRYVIPIIKSDLMSTEDINLIFKTELIQIFVERGFTVTITKDGLKDIIIIEWISGLTKEDKDKRKKLLDHYTK